jgi:hypothetical protein
MSSIVSLMTVELQHFSTNFRYVVHRGSTNEIRFIVIPTKV